MTDVIKVALIAATPPTLMSFFSLIAGIVNKLRGDQRASQIQALQISINGRMEELLRLSKVESRAEGIKQEHDRQEKP